MTGINNILHHFQTHDPVIYRQMTKAGIKPLPEPLAVEDYFFKLCREIIAQQLAGKAADAIIGRFRGLFPEGLTPQAVLKIPDQAVRDAGLSWAKVRYVKDLAQKVSERAIHLGKLASLDDESVVKELVKVKGIGRWTAEMFLMFTLGRENVFSHGDLGLYKAIRRLYGLKVKPTVAEVEKIITPWTPYKTYASLALWSVFD